jgi:hypothetical protein
MPLTTEQLQTLKTAILADPVLASLPLTSASAGTIADVFNATAVPSFTVWRTDVASDEIGNAWVGTDIDGMSALNMQRLQLLLASSRSGVFDMSRADRRAGFENPFGTNQNNASRVAMRAVWKRLSTRFEWLFATGTGSDAAPGILVVEGDVSSETVQLARELP